MQRPTKKIENWLFQPQPLTRWQKASIRFAFVSCLFSTAVCAPMGGSGVQSVFQTKNPAAYWSFFFLSPILILCLCGRATYYRTKELTKPYDQKWEILRKPSEPQRTTKIIWGILGMLSGAINAYNTTEYVPGTLGKICFPFALCVPGIVNVPAIQEYHRRIFSGTKWLFLKTPLLKPPPESNRDHLAKRLYESKRLYAQLSYAHRERLNARFSHPSEENKIKLNMLFNASGDMQEKHTITYFFAALGLLVGTLSQVFAYKLGREIGSKISAEPVIQFAFGVGCAYLGIGMVAIACSDVFSEMSDRVHHLYTTGICSTKSQHNAMRLALFVLALAASSCFVENQVQVMGQEGFGGKLLTICAIISPTCIGFWAGDRILQDGLSSSFMYFHKRLEAALPEMKDECVAEILDNCTRTG